MSPVQRSDREPPSHDRSSKQHQYYNIMNKLEIEGDWNIATGKLKQKWAQLTDDDLQYAGGKMDELFGRIQKRTGATREAVEDAIAVATKKPDCGCKQC